MAASKASAASKNVKESLKSVGKKEKKTAVAEVKEASVSPVRTGRRSGVAAAAPSSPSVRRSPSPAPLKTKKAAVAVKKEKVLKVKEEKNSVEEEAEVVKATPLIKKKSAVVSAPVAANCSDSRSCGSSCFKKMVNGYLFLYNAASAVAWAYLMFSLGRSFFFDEPQNTRVLFGKTGMYLAYLQTFALLEVLHAALGLVRSGVMSNVIQISSRLFVIWVAAVMGETGKHWAYAMMATAWSISDFTRYAYYLTQLTKVSCCGCLKWARYNFFLVLYPVGTLGEAILIYLARLNKFSADPILNFGLLTVLAIYTPGFLYMYSHMLQQRAKHYRCCEETAAPETAALASSESKRSKRKVK